MALDPSISLNVQPAQIQSPLAAITGAVQLRDLMVQQQLKRQQIAQSQVQTEDLQAQAQERQRDLADQSTVQGVQGTKEFHDAYASGDVTGLLGGRVQSKTIIALNNSALAAKEKASQLDEKGRAKASEAAGKLTNILAGLDPNDDQAAADQLKAGATNMGVQYPEYAHQVSAFQDINKDNVRDVSKNMMDTAGLTKSVMDAVTEQQKKLQDVQTSKAAADKDTKQGNLALAETPGAQAKSEVESIRLQMMKDAGDPDIAAKVIGNIASPGTPLYKGLLTAYMAAPSPEMKHEVLEKGLTVLGESDPAVIQARIKQAVGTAAATLPIEVNKAVQTQIALAKNAPGAFNQIIETAARTRAENQYDAATKEYHDKAMTAKSVEDMIDAAQGGNRAAPAVIPIAELRTFITRPNIQELRGVGNAGSWIDKVTGFIDGAKKGQSIPAGILDGVRGIAEIQKDVASQRYDLAIKSLQAKGANPPRIELPGDEHKDVPAEVKKVLTGQGAGIHTLSDGSKWMVDPSGSISNYGNSTSGNTPTSSAVQPPNAAPVKTGSGLPKEVEDIIPEGKTVVSPTKERWKKIGGKLVKQNATTP